MFFGLDLVGLQGQGRHEPMIEQPPLIISSCHSLVWELWYCSGFNGFMTKTNTKQQYKSNGFIPNLLSFKLFHSNENESVVNENLFHRSILEQSLDIMACIPHHWVVMVWETKTANGCQQTFNELIPWNVVAAVVTGHLLIQFCLQPLTLVDGGTRIFHLFV